MVCETADSPRQAGVDHTQDMPFEWRALGPAAGEELAKVAAVPVAARHTSPLGSASRAPSVAAPADAFFSPVTSVPRLVTLVASDCNSASGATLALFAVTVVASDCSSASGAALALFAVTAATASSI
eukprot:scaffold36272_cov116-Isochrysis_galbana.AAC.4